MKVLLIDDERDSIKGIIEHCEGKGWEVDAIVFEGYAEKVAEMNPDIVVLDWKDGTTDKEAGNKVLEDIWINGFRPVIIFSALADAITLDEKYNSSNLIIRQAKGDEQPVTEYLDSLCPFTPVISSLKNEFNNALMEALNSIEMMRQVPKKPSDKIMRYVFAKRVSNYFDCDCEQEVPPAWVQYTYPTLSEALRAADVIRILTESTNTETVGAPEEYRLVLTPSCDLAHKKVDYVLCAKCYSKEFFYAEDRYYREVKDGKRYIESKLNAGYNNRWLALPEIPVVLPWLTADLRKPELIPIEEIALSKKEISDSKKYLRIATIDSPFREQVVWAYMMNACKPGVPARDTREWANELEKK